MDRRRSSYASVVAGGAGSSAGQTPPARAGAFSHMLPQNPPPSSSLGQLPDPPAPDDPAGAGVPASWGKSTAIPAHWNQQSYERPSGAAAGPMFLRPSYLRGSRYLERLEAAARARAVAGRDAAPAAGSGGGGGATSLSTSSSSASLARLAPSHRGMTYEIVESRPPPPPPPPLGAHAAAAAAAADDDDAAMGPPPLPSRWTELDRHGGLDVPPETAGTDIKYGAARPQEHEAAAARTDHPMPPECGIYYYEVEVISKGKDGYGPDTYLLEVRC